MKINAIETIRLSEHPNSIWIHLHTSEGIVGLGETYGVPGAVEAFIHEYAAQLLLGESVFDREKHWTALFSNTHFWGNGGAEMRGISAIDIGLWDAIGQYLDQPIYNLIGGRSRDSIPVYNTCVNTPLYQDQTAFMETPGELAQSLVADGFVQMKVWPWDVFAPQIVNQRDPGGAGRTALGPPGHYLTAAQLKQGLWTVQEIRKAVGDQIEIAIEGHSRWDVNCAIQIAWALEPYGVVWMEDFIQPESADDLARLAQETRVPQAVSERLFGKWAFKDILNRRAAHIVMLDVNWTGGITEALKVAALADAYHLAVTPHDCTGPVLVAANLHICAAVPNAMIVEIVRGYISGHYQQLLTTALPIRDGRAWFDELGPGLGVALRPQILNRSDVRRRLSSLS